MKEVAVGGIIFLKRRIEAETNLTITVTSIPKKAPSWPSGITITRMCRNIWIWISSWSQGSGRSKSQHRPSLPQYNPHSLTTITASPQPQSPPEEPLLLLSCMPRGRGKHLFQDDIQKVGNDQDLMYFLRDVYKKHRSRYRSVFSLKEVQSLALAKVYVIIAYSFTLSANQFPDIVSTPPWRYRCHKTPRVRL